MKLSHEIWRYSIIAASYLISSISEDDLKYLHNVVLFGSVVHGNATNESDIDIFFDMDVSKRKEVRLRSTLNKSAEQFYLSNLALEFKLRGISNELSIKVGNLKKWPDLAKNISSSG